MKKKKAAKMLSPNERALRERVRLRDHARSVAFEIRQTWGWLDRAIEAAEGSDAECFCLERVKDSWFMAGNLMNFGSPAMMRTVADALDGKSLLSKRDEELLATYAEAMRTGKRRAGRSMSLAPFPSEVYDKLPAKREGTKRKDTRPLTPKDIQTIRDLEASGIRHGTVENEIKKRYQHTDSGDPVAINENGDAPLAKGTPKRKERNKEAMSRRLKVLGRPLSEKPGAPRKRP